MTVALVPADWDFASSLPFVATDFNAVAPFGFLSSIGTVGTGAFSIEYPISEPTYPPVASHKLTTYAEDFLERIHVTPSAIDFANIIGNAQRTVEIWNAFGRAIRLNTITTSGTEGLTLTGQPAPPLDFLPLQDRTFTINASPAGPPVLAGFYAFAFSNSETRTVTLSGKRIIAWPWRPDWTRGIMERLEFKTDVLRTYDAREQRRRLRQGARRLIEFDTLVTDAERRLFETAIGGWQARIWALPLWWSGRSLTSNAAAGATSLAVSTASSDFQVGGFALILDQDGNSEVVEIAAIAGSLLTLARATLSAWTTLATVFPAVSARLDQSLSFGRFLATAAYGRLRFTQTDAANYTAVSPVTTFSGYPVLEARSESGSGEIDLQVTRKLEEYDNQIAAPVVDDEGDLALLQQSHGFFAGSVAAKASLRALIYALAGRWQAVWLPSWTDDLTVVADIGLSAATIDVANTKYGLYLSGLPGRNHIAIYRTDGSVSYHKITGSTEVSATVERLTISPVAPVAIPAATVQRVSFLSLVRQSADSTELMHWTADTLEVSTSFSSFRHDV